MKKYFILSLACLLASVSIAQNKPQISLLTFSPGMESHSIFGHTAIRVKDLHTETDLVYNFGVFDFDTPNFMLQFIKGDLNYKLGIHPYSSMLPGYFNENRQIYEQELNLGDAQTKQLLDKLAYKYRPENRYYQYRFLERNCSTELRDLFFKEIAGVSYVPFDTKKTYRHYLVDYSKTVPWFKFGINLALGSTIDREISSNELMFLPDYLSSESERGLNKKEPFMGRQKKVFQNLEVSNLNKWGITPFVLFCFLFVVMVLGKSRVLIQTFTLSVGLFGVVLIAIQLISAHPEVHQNYNLLWCNPLYLVSYGLCFTQFKKVHRVWAIILLLCLIAMIYVWVFKIQGFDFAFFPIVISLFWINLKQAQRK